MAFATGVAVASNYYAQPLLHTISESLDISFARAGMLVTAAQLSYGLGVILLVPLGDIFERRRLIVVMSLLSAAGLVISALSQQFLWLVVGTALTGLFSVVAQVLVPFAATLARPEERGRRDDERAAAGHSAGAYRRRRTVFAGRLADGVLDGGGGDGADHAGAVPHPAPLP